MFNPNYPSIQDLKKKASRNIPTFAFDYLTGGANEEINLARNKSDIQQVELMPQYLKDFDKADLSTELFGHEYNAPFGISPIGLQGLIWPNSPEILAKAALAYNVPFILSTVTTASIERISDLTEGKFWFQLYHPAEDSLRDKLLKRASDAGCDVLVALADTPSFGIRYKDIRNGLSMPPSMSLRNVLQILAKPIWALKTLYHGKPEFTTLLPYMPKNMNMSQLGQFMNKTFNGRLNEEKIKGLRDRWKGKLVIKGVVNEMDAQKALLLGADGIIVSNHGGRQLDAGQSTIKPLGHLAKSFEDKMTVMMDGGVRSGPDIARCIASGAKFVFLGRPFMYGVGALGNEGGNHTMELLKMQLQQVMEQLGCEKMEELPQRLILPS
ncbi:alpha-hydroxy-acid oxidizing protein [Fulvivirga sp. M361]|uniref:alpha-hydroxy acid oxidase n=1 Tax=Fulvivirga sp. M361 TaxID=2594266 RepID=UPI00117B5160|nr:alpha-hydroxy acid oxidase [Fulvivirga sp. M361]TRX48596.1 alpha-hydroxy-acid oxidizing protein [Fulvivirga sp. M361]